MKTKYDIEVDCANCASKLESEVSKINGVENCVVTFMTQKMFVGFSEGADKKAVMAEILRVAKKVDPDIVIYN